MPEWIVMREWGHHQNGRWYDRSTIPAERSESEPPTEFVITLTETWMPIGQFETREDGETAEVYTLHRQQGDWAYQPTEEEPQE